MKSELIAFVLLCLIGCEKSSEEFPSKKVLDEKSGGINHGINTSPTSREFQKLAEDYRQMLVHRSSELLAETGPEKYVDTRDRIWNFGETGLIDYSDRPEYVEIINNKDLDYRLKHHPNFMFDGEIFNLLRDARKETPAIRFRIGYLVLLRLASHPKEGNPLWKTAWKNTGPPALTVEAAIELMSEASGEDLRKYGAFTNDLFQHASEWLSENPL
jgi:hypothetical protein